MVIKARGELLEVTDKVNLTVSFKDGSGNYIDTDLFPTISIVQPSGNVLFTPTSAGVARTDVGRYSFLFEIPLNGPFGVWNDYWTGIINGYQIETSGNFIVSHTDLPAINSDGYIALGDDPGFNYSQTALLNINKVIKIMKARLNSTGKSYMVDSNGNPGYVDCDMFSVEMLATFAAASLADFNQVPYFTGYTFEHTYAIDQFIEIIAMGGVIYALASKALIERGKEFQFTDNGINFQPPTVSDLMMTQYNAMHTQYWDKVKYIKNSIRPGPLGLGIFSMTNGINPAVNRLRHLRARRII